MSKDYLEYLRHIKDECEYLTKLRQGLDYDSFVADEDLKRASIRSLEIIGEASKKVPEDFRRKHREIDWRQMAGMRDVLIHDYMDVDYLIVWGVLIRSIPVLLVKINGLLESS
jgi:uncharacterized protein with HEPN domain